ncbi:DUF885 family protein [uncultured Paraglaciecola sp.]|mgnify:CR=1 FL=1|uniref:DUF885 family protein n=1 Tax=uncultured Paraglaciecola sp. TaxID=1765024 RepID=UPI00262792FA|nr:DUF885 family protein [uncultured Paraglaciecola sp.]
MLSFSYVCGATGTSQLQSLLDEIWQYDLSINPIAASQLGVHDFDHKLADISPEALAKQDTQFRAFLKKLAKIDKSELKRTEQINLLIQQRQLQDAIDQYRFNSVIDYQNYLARLSQFPSYFAQQIEWMKKGIQSGFVQPKAVLVGFEDSVKAFIQQQ